MNELSILQDLRAEVERSGYSSTKTRMTSGDWGLNRRLHVFDGNSPVFTATVWVEDAEAGSVFVELNDIHGVTNGEMRFFAMSTTVMARAILTALDDKG